MRTLQILLWALVLIAGGAWAWTNLRPAARDAAAPTNTLADTVGGPFALTSHTGAAVTDRDFAGKYMLIYFGYTYCPDVCPIELGTIAQALDRLERAGRGIDHLQPLFITVDPARDTVPVMADYVAAFHPRLIGLTGTQDQIRAVMEAYRIYARKGEDMGDGAYLVDHLSLIYLTDRDGRLLRFFPRGTTAEELARALAELDA